MDREEMAREHARVFHASFNKKYFEYPNGICTVKSWKTSHSGESSTLVETVLTRNEVDYYQQRAEFETR